MDSPPLEWFNSWLSKKGIDARKTCLSDGYHILKHSDYIAIYTYTNNGFSLIWEEHFPEYSHRIYRRIQNGEIPIESFMENPDRYQEQASQSY